MFLLTDLWHLKHLWWKVFPRAETTSPSTYWLHLAHLGRDNIDIRLKLTFYSENWYLWLYGFPFVSPSSHIIEDHVDLYLLGAEADLIALCAIISRVFCEESSCNYLYEVFISLRYSVWSNNPILWQLWIRNIDIQNLQSRVCPWMFVLTICF